MASDFTTYLASNLLDWVTNNGVALTRPTALYIALFTADPTASGVFTNEISTSGTAYARQSVAFNDSGGTNTTENTSKITFPTATASWGTVTHFAIVDSDVEGAGNQLYNDQLTASKAVGIGDTFEFAAGAIDLTHSTAD